jgi:single-strand DNA-binding protein
MIRASVHGRVGADPVQRETRGGHTMVTASIAVNVAKPGDEPATEWVSLVAFGKAAEALARHTKSDLLSAMGPLTKSSFTDREGNEKASWSLVAESLLSARTVYDQPEGSNAATRPRRTRAPSRPLYSAPKRPAASLPELPADRVDDLYSCEDGRI